MLRIGHNKISHIVQQGNQVQIENLRDFSWTVEDYGQKENWITEKYDSSLLQSVSLFVCPFGPFQLVAHTFLSFHFSDGKSLCVSVEIQAQQGESYNYFKAFLNGYRSIVIWGTERDIIGLRTNIRNEPVIRYPLHIRHSSIKKLFKNLIKNTNLVNENDTRYLVVRNNCTTAIWNIAREIFPLPRRHRSLFFSAYLPNYLGKLGIINLSEGKKL
ncbi:MAG TPA: DUF4105 domain-containing protein [Candidatus Absconditabacterales bacterium]|nr:DUF4105 domain-containing protein [Candidatus Absconditabacterales bacterium]